MVNWWPGPRCGAVLGPLRREAEKLFTVAVQVETKELQTLPRVKGPTKEVRKHNAL